MTTYDTAECKGRLCNPPYREMTKMIDGLQQNPFRNPCISNLFNFCHLSLYLPEHEENSRTSSFEEGAPDVAQNVAHELNFCYSGQVLIEGPLKAYRSKGESLGHDTFCGISPRDHKYL